MSEPPQGNPSSPYPHDPGRQSEPYGAPESPASQGYPGGQSQAGYPQWGGQPQDQSHEWRFVPPAAGAPRGSHPRLHIRDSWPTFRVFERVTSPRPSGAGLNGFVGRYRSDDTDMTYTVRLVEGRLQLSWPRDYTVALDAVGGDHFVGARGTVTFVRTAAGDISGLTISNRRLRRLFAARVGAECGGS